ncbi:anti-sigma W factor [Paenibacillus swuensis]|uniref:Anti-sigma-W factor RsiW n=1 Tax=Paenibacillus swuensis TaxID=1178515 RepID=A0A172TFP7_9BACL|nr:zf-HC2 domain-containing protein [Paenibacillus swuensis]ANE45885.1 anti-sigma W factor [Paenibacillus swuensis]
MDCRQANSLIHNYLDGDLDPESSVKLNSHLRECAACNAHFKKLEHTSFMLGSMEPVKAPDDFTARLMAQLPAKKQQNNVQNRVLQWVRRHPAVSAAAVFFLIMMSSFMSLWNQEGELVVKGADLSQVVIQGDTVIVPEGHKVAGNLTVENGRTEIYGDVEGNLTVIDGSMNLASTAHISGQIDTVNQALDWIWYKIGEWFK